MKISIILPVKDTSKYLKECLDSIVGQSYTDWELLAVNDNSSDNCLSILQKYAAQDDRVIALDNPDPSLLNALRYGYTNSSGILIHRMDSDDIMPLNKLELMTGKFDFENLKLAGGIVVTGGTKYFKDDGEVGDGFKRYDAWLMNVARNNSHKTEMYKECVIPSNCWLVHREDFDKIGGFSPDIFPEDYDLCFRFIEGGLSVVGIPEVLHHWRDRSDRISRNWEVYKDNRFFQLKMNYFYKMTRDTSRPLVLWGAGKNGKDLAKLIKEQEEHFYWVCDNQNKIGKDIYNIRLEHFFVIDQIKIPQIIIGVASPNGQDEISLELDRLKLKKGEDYWFFA
tara:strand:- start:1228 stop:2241 length:1014 start_codon:yes stop_codon:yes gene_type:complete